MALVAWYKLDGNALDSSEYGNHGEVHGATAVSGKIGQAMNFNGVDNYIQFENANHLNISNEISISLWVKWRNITSGGSFNGGVLISKTIGTAYTTHGFHIGIDWLILQWRTSDSNGSNSVDYATSNFVMDRWYHLTFVLSHDGTQTIYRDGIQVAQTKFATKRDISINAPIRLGRGYNTNFDGMLDDVRIYNHALSEKEIKELSKAKILHMKFDDFQEPTKNLVLNPEEQRSTTTYNVMQGYLSENWIEGEQYTISLKGTINSGQSFRLWRDSGSIAATTSIPYNSEKGFYTLTFTCPPPRSPEYQLDRFSIYNYPSAGASQATIEWIQIEKKDHVTPFVNGERAGTVHDCSGYDNHAELALATTPRWTKDSKVGSGAYSFSPGKHIYLGNPENIPSQTYTYSLWIKHNSSGDGFRQFVSRSPRQPSLWLYTANNIIHYSIQLSTGANTSIDSVTGLSPNIWYHLVVSCSWNGSVTQLKTYVNGNLENHHSVSASPTDSISPISIGGQNIWIDDFRIYATALSDDDIKELYQNRASLDSRGNFYFHQLEQPPATEGLVGWWKLDGNAKDSSGHNNHGTVSGATITDGIMGQAYEFIENSVVNNISFGDVTSYKITQTLWINKKSLSEIHRICSIHPFACGFSGSSFFAHNATSAGSDNNVPYGTINLETNKWHFLAIVRDMIDDKRVRVYLDGKLRLEGVPPNAIGGYMTMGNFTIGYSSSTQYFDGKIDDVRIYNRALSETEIDVLYKTGRGLI